ncbi:SDR family NAD(P)-dependent oxidoreductase [Sabulicella rubraurantiaca]|uniref:SDR family NAD(P)-dependent oxidoreductase n=1 Tax=Sabulicella rubraurantiaca TaxID=2811429 RepID=UPI001A97A44A|nr:SDR family NAD(P)-dependent oxidoreductase [Sabulicella rubraurantiaca]
MSGKPLALVTGASSGIGLELARIAAREGHDLVICADEARIEEAAAELRGMGAEVTAVEADLATEDGVFRLHSALGSRRVDVLCANAGRGLGHAFLDQDWKQVRRVVDTNVTGTIMLIQKVGREMRQAGGGRILITGSVAGYLPGAFHAVYNGTKAFIDSFAAALRNEVQEHGISVTCLMPGATETEFFERAGMEDTKVGAGSKDDAAAVAETGWKAMVKGEGQVVHGLMNKVQTTLANVTPAAVLAQQHRKQAEPGSAKE